MTPTQSRAVQHVKGNNTYSQNGESFFLHVLVDVVGLNADNLVCRILWRPAQPSDRQEGDHAQPTATSDTRHKQGSTPRRTRGPNRRRPGTGYTELMVRLFF